MGKKIAIGCLGIGMLILVAGGYFGYNLLYKPIMDSISSLEEIHQTNEQIANQSEYTPPDDRELTEEQVDRFIRVQTEIQQNLEDRLAEFQEKYEEMEEKLQDRDPSIREIMGVWDDLVTLYKDAKRIQVDALNQEDFSLQEYRFVQQSFYQALGVEMFAYDVDSIAKAASEGNFQFNMEEFEAKKQEFETEVPERNRELVSPYSESAELWVNFAWLGL